MPKSKTQDEERRARELEQHCARLGLPTECMYLKWCKKHGFKATTKKQPWDMKRELDFHISQQTRAALKANNASTTVRRALQLMADGVDPSEIDGEWQHKKFIKKIADKGLLEMREFAILVLTLAHSRRFDLDERYLTGLAELLRHKGHWVRQPDTWKAPSHNPDRQFFSLARHLLANYEVPGFLDKHWFLANSRYQEWFIHLGKGSNLRRLEYLPFPLTKLMAHHALSAPRDYQIEQALLYGQVRGSGGGHRLADTIARSRIPTLFPGEDRNEFKLAMIRFFVANPMLDPRQISPLADYIHSQKYGVGVRTVVAGRGYNPAAPAPNPNFSFTGRTANALVAQMEAWHRQLGLKRGGTAQHWPHSRYHDSVFPEGQPGQPNYREWQVLELISSDELFEEGRAMGHCVFSYASSCINGRCTIWSLFLKSSEGGGRRLTFEVSGGAVVQARGRGNRPPSDQELSILNQWASLNGLSLSPIL